MKNQNLLEVYIYSFKTENTLTNILFIIKDEKTLLKEYFLYLIYYLNRYLNKF